MDMNSSIARSNAYLFLGDLFLRGPVPDLQAHIQAIPELAAHLYNSPGGELLPEEELAADHYDIFGLNIYPFESAFLEPELVLDGPVTEAVQNAYRVAGFRHQNTDVSSDHLGLELHFLGVLCREEAESGMAALATRQHSFLRGHLLRWLPLFLYAVHLHANPFYSALAVFAYDLASQHFAAIDGKLIASTPVFALPKNNGLLDNPQTRLSDIARLLLSPSRSGFYLSREGIRRLARSLNLPSGFGDRQQLLTNLFHSAADYNLIPALTNQLRASLEGWEEHYISLCSDSLSGRAMLPLLLPWQEQLRNTRIILERIAMAAQTPQDTEL